MKSNQIKGFSVNPHPKNNRLTVVTLSSSSINGFCKKVAKQSVQSIEYKPFLRFHVANCLNQETNNTLGDFLLNTIKDRQTGAVLLQCESLDSDTLNNIDFIDFNILLSTAISHLIGVPNLDSMSGKFYARFSVKNEDNSDSYLRQAHRRMELHTDGTYVKEHTDWVIMQKMLEIDVEGGESLLLHVMIGKNWINSTATIRPKRRYNGVHHQAKTWVTKPTTQSLSKKKNKVNRACPLLINLPNHLIPIKACTFMRWVNL